MRYLSDRDRTIINRQGLLKNKNLMLWYEDLYRMQFSGIEDPENKRILEIGSGTSPLKHFLKNVITTDIMDLDYLDYRLDFHEIDRFSAVEDNSLDIITMTNVLHHLHDPISCLEKASFKLKEGGQVIAAEPYFSRLSFIIYKLFHHEPSLFRISEPKISTDKGPLTGANMAVPYLIFFSRQDWRERVMKYYTCSGDDISYYSSLSYFITGGISMRFPVNHNIYRGLMEIDSTLARKMPGLLASFFIVKLHKKSCVNPDKA